jgi:dihydrofolate reductase
MPFELGKTMRKLILGVAMSLDGFIEGPHGEYDWCFTDQDYGMKEFLRSIDAIVYGRKSYEVMLKEIERTGQRLFMGKTNYVFSRTVNQLPGATVINGNLKQEVAALKGKPGKDIWLFGGAELTTGLMNAGLVDEVWLSIHPIVLGGGKILFKELTERNKLELIETKTYTTGLVSVRYAMRQVRSESALLGKLMTQLHHSVGGLA